MCADWHFAVAAMICPPLYSYARHSNYGLAREQFLPFVALFAFFSNGFITVKAHRLQAYTVAVANGLGTVLSVQMRGALPCLRILLPIVRKRPSIRRLRHESNAAGRRALSYNPVHGCHLPNWEEGKGGTCRWTYDYRE